MYKKVEDEEIRESKLYDVDRIMEIIGNQFENIMGWDPDYYSGHEIVIKNEQMYITNYDENEDYDYNKIYLTVKFLPAEINLGQNLIPITISAVAEKNKFQLCQRLLMEYAQVFNLRSGSYLDENRKISYNQTYDAPSVMSNFESVFDGLRSLLMISGEFLVSANMNVSELYYYPDGPNGENVLVERLNKNDSFDVSLDPQAYTTTKNFTKSTVKFGTNSFAFTVKLMSNELCNTLLKIKYKILPIDIDFVFGTKYSNQIDLKGDEEPFVDVYKLQNFTIDETIGEFAVITATFTN